MTKRRKNRYAKEREPTRSRKDSASDSASESAPGPARHDKEFRKSVVVGRLPDDVIAAIESAEYGLQPR